MKADLLASCEIWWHGPEFLSQNKDLWPTEAESVEIRPLEEKKSSYAYNLVTNSPSHPVSLECNLLERFSSLTHLLRFTCIYVRFIVSINIVRV